MKLKSAFSYIVFFLMIPLCIAVGIFAFGEKAYLPISICTALLSCIPFFITFEKKDGNIQLSVILAVMTALSVLGRFAFAALPHFKPVAAIVIITGMYLGVQSGFLFGALSAILSNILFGQGPWTPFQMLAWGLIGFLAGLLAKKLVESKVLLIIYGALSGIAFSFIMDVWTTLWADGTFNIARFVASITTAAFIFS